MILKDVISEHQLNRYFRFINNYKHKEIDGFYEIHHIIPRSLGGTDDASNLIKLTARQHFIAHMMLNKIFKGNSAIKMHHAVWCMANTNKNIKVTSKIYESLRNKRVKLLSATLRGKNNPMYGKKLTEEHKKRISDKLKGKKKPEGFSEKISLRVKGSGNPQYNKLKTQKQIDASRKAALTNNPMKNLLVVEKIKKCKEGTINCYDLLLNKFIRIKKEIFYSDSRYVGTTSKLIPKEIKS
jgi:hypothetical protein